MDQDETCHAGRPRPWPHCVRWDPAPPPQRGRASPIFGPYVMAKWLDRLRCHLVAYGGRPRPRQLCVRWGPSSPLPKRGRSPPQFSAHVYCGKTAGWIKMALGMEVGFGPGHIVLDGDPAPLSRKGARAPLTIFGPFLLWPNGWMDQNATWYGGRPRPRRLRVR